MTTNLIQERITKQIVQEWFKSSKETASKYMKERVSKDWDKFVFVFTINPQEKEKYAFGLLKLTPKKETLANKKYTSYNTCLDESFDLLWKYDIVDKDEAPSVSISDHSDQLASSTLSNDDISTKYANKIESDGPLTQEDITDFVKDDTISKIECYEDKDAMRITMAHGWFYDRDFSTSVIISLLVSYVENEVERKKNLWTVINKEITIYYLDNQYQTLRLYEGEDGNIEIDSGGASSNEKWLIDESLTNTFVISSLSELSVNSTKLKIWLKNTLLSDDIHKIYF